MWKPLIQIASCTLLFLPLIGQHAKAQTSTGYPTKTVKLIVPFPPGGTTDSITRIVGNKLSAKWGQPVIVENRPGAGGNIAGAMFAKSDPDGYTLFSSAPGPLTINFSLFKNLNFDPRKFVSVSMIADMPNALVVGPSVKAKTLQELIAYAKQNPGKVTFATQGNGTTSHLTAVLFQSLTGIKMLHVPYKGSSPALTDMIGGQVDMMFDNITTSLPFYNQKRVNILAVTTKSRVRFLPNVSTAAEAGLPNFESGTWVGVVAPQGTPTAIAEKINKDIAEIIKQPDVIKQFADLGAEPLGGTPADMSAFLRSESNKWRKVIDSASITAD
jgi:tripartite-type tricarboxylate transporter receptor subunit TctC